MALNFQSRGLPMDLNNGRFRDNGGCGYVLKPHFLRSGEATFDPGSLPPDLKPVQVLMKVPCAHILAFTAFHYSQLSTGSRKQTKTNDSIALANGYQIVGLQVGCGSFRK